ncbi:MAG: cobyrinate a,c-diamide synthase [Ethanoligenens sp.]
MTANPPRILFAAPGSGSGKTLAACAVLSALRGKGVESSAFKCGPDYIDPMFHRKVLEKNSANLDLFLMGADACRRLLTEGSSGASFSLIEGVMGYYDGLGRTDRYSSYHLAREMSTPVVLIVDCSGMAVTLAAILNGMASYRSDSEIKGVIFNRIKPGMYAFYRSVVEENTPLKVLGFLPEMLDCRFDSRHLGLITADEIGDIQSKMEKLGAQAVKSIDLDALIQIARSAGSFSYMPLTFDRQFDVKIAVAQDRAFCFYYRDSLAVLEKLGARLIFFSPLAGEPLPACDGLLLGGGYPELYLEQLSKNSDVLAGIRKAVLSGMPCVAECGGFLFLQKGMRNAHDKLIPMVGALEGEAFMTGGLKRFGYVKLTAKCDNLLCAAGESLSAHEFHYSDSTFCGDSFTAEKPGGTRQYACIAAGPTLFAGYPHIHFAGQPKAAVRFVAACAAFQAGNSPRHTPDF